MATGKIGNKLFIWGDDGNQYISGTSFLPDANGEVAGFNGGSLIYAQEINRAVRNSTIFQWAIADIVADVTENKLGNYFDITFDTATANLSTFKSNLKTALECYIINSLPDAGSSQRGLVTTGAQTFGGTKTFSEISVTTLGATNINGTTITATSDRRLKENIRKYSCEKSILDLPIYKFDFIDGRKNVIGCMAQDLQEICPEIVRENPNGYLSIEESKIIYLLIEEIKKLRKEIKGE